MYKELNQFVEAESCYLAALEIDPNFPAVCSLALFHLLLFFLTQFYLIFKANNNIAVIYSMQGRVREATAHLETAIRNNPEYGT